MRGLAAAAALLAATTSLVVAGGTAGATTSPEQTGWYGGGCAPVGGTNVACLIYGVTASGVGPEIVYTPAVTDGFSGWYHTASGWIQGINGYIRISYNSQGTLLTGVTSGTPEQVSSWPYDNNFTLEY